MVVVVVVVLVLVVVVVVVVGRGSFVRQQVSLHEKTIG